jgi:hypothetical protein
MHRLLRYFSVLVLLGFLYGNPSALLGMSGGVSGSSEAAASEHCHHEDGHSHGQAGHGSLLCLLASGVPNLLVQSSAVDAPYARRAIALVPPAGADVPRATTLDRDPPIPRHVS